MPRTLQVTSSFCSSLGLLVAFVTLVSALLGSAQDPVPAAPATPPPPPVLENNGKPIVIPFQCTDEDIHRAGLSCTEEEPCPVYLELSAADASGSRVVAAGNIHTSAVTLYSVILLTEDLGRTWREPHARIRAAGLDHIQFFDPETGWIGGLVLSPLPQEPFLMVTQDGGKNWRQRPILNESAENRFGSIPAVLLRGEEQRQPDHRSWRRIGRGPVRIVRVARRRGELVDQGVEYQAAAAAPSTARALARLAGARGRADTGVPYRA
jgi:hypothetical protein